MTQTVNVCTEQNERGWYEHIYRISQPNPFVASEQVAANRTLAELDAWLLGLGAAYEGSRRGGSGGDRSTPRTIPAVPAPAEGDPWLENATRVVEVAIDSLLWEFVEHPYLHRVEHSLHTRLFGILAAHPVFAHLLPIGTTGRCTQPVHKEWPETIAREEKDGRRGLFDLAILGREQLSSATLEQFCAGRIDAAIVIEMGLDYSLDHLSGDHEKLLNSGVAAGFLVHFSRKGRRDPAVEDLILNPTYPVKTVYAHHGPDGVCTFKTLDSPDLQSLG
ncbi:MAG: hypothetical protein JXA67_15430 [Micromonosporaceae bacterium]|nr:hypothetical protein [Micromonosporaceae bacterium]